LYILFVDVHTLLTGVGDAEDWNCWMTGYFHLSGPTTTFALQNVSFKPGSVDGIRQVVSIVASNPHFPIILQWTGGHAGGHHSCKDFH